MGPVIAFPKNEALEKASARTGPSVELPPLRWSGRISLTRRILAVNIFAIAFLAGGFFYLDSYRTRMVDARMELYEQQLDLLAAALRNVPPAAQESMLADFARETGVRIRRYDASGRKIADSVALGVAERELRDPAEEPWKRHVARFLDRMVDSVVFADRPPDYREPARDVASAWPEIVDAHRRGGSGTLERYAPDRTPVISAAQPLADGGSLLALANARDITKVVRAERLRLAILFLMALIASVLLSLFLARTIVQPLRRLAAAAIRVRLGRAREVSIPLLPSRRDEIGLLARAVSDMTHALRQRIDATDAFAADVTHELKNPIASLRSALESLEKVDAPELRARLMAIAQDDVRRLDRLVTEIAEASRIDAQLSRTKFERIDLGALIEKIVMAHEARGIERDVRIAFARPRKDVATVMGEEGRLVRVIENLLDNAISFSPDGGLVRIVATEADGKVLLSMEDEGPGVPPQERETVFRRFHSVRPASEAFGKHSGLGLAIARSIVEGHQGTVSIADREDEAKGARFIIKLPPAATIDEPTG